MNRRQKRATLRMLQASRKNKIRQKIRVKVTVVLPELRSKAGAVIRKQQELVKFKFKTIFHPKLS